jgi:hypothetical protein
LSQSILSINEATASVNDMLKSPGPRASITTLHATLDDL